MKTKKILLALVLVIGISVAEAQVVSKDDIIANFGLGFGSTLYSGSYYYGTIPPLSGSVELILEDDIVDGNAAFGVGGYIGYSGFKSKYTTYHDPYGYKYSNLIIGPRGYFHYYFIENLDTYCGAMLGYWGNSSKYYGSSLINLDASKYGGFIWSWFIGGRYYFQDNLAAMLELGYGISYVNLGVAIKFGKN